MDSTSTQTISFLWILTFTLEPIPAFHVTEVKQVTNVFFSLLLAMNVDEDASIVAKQPSKKPKNTRKEIRKIKKDSKRKPRNLISFKKKAVNPNAKRRRMPRI
jgi:hypothetical protein